MGLYDTVSFNCPRCHAPMQKQSKAGPCRLSEYDIYEAPAEIIIRFHNTLHECDECGSVFRILAHTTPIFVLEAEM